jgi:hypothetical protein
MTKLGVGDNKHGVEDKKRWSRKDYKTSRRK